MEFKESKSMRTKNAPVPPTTSPSPSPPKPSKWGAAGWWFVTVYSVPFAVYAAIFVSGNYHLYRRFTLTFLHGNHDEAGLNIKHHVQAWQTHAFAAILFVLLVPFQFAPNFRKKHHLIHRCMGYTFVASAITLSISGNVFMVRYSEFHTWGKVIFVIAGVYLLACVIIAVAMARPKKFMIHQRFMIRTAAVGYSYAAMRIFIPIFKAIGIIYWTAADIGAWVSVVGFVGVIEANT